MDISIRHVLLRRTKKDLGIALKIDLRSETPMLERVIDLTDKTQIEFKGFSGPNGYEYAIYKSPLDYLSIGQGRGKPLATVYIKDKGYSILEGPEINKIFGISPATALKLAEEEALFRVLD
jgi:hypothetical protein